LIDKVTKHGSCPRRPTTQSVKLGNSRGCFLQMRVEPLKVHKYLSSKNYVSSISRRRNIR